MPCTSQGALLRFSSCCAALSGRRVSHSSHDWRPSSLGQGFVRGMEAPENAVPPGQPHACFCTWPLKMRAPIQNLPLLQHTCQGSRQLLSPNSQGSTWAAGGVAPLLGAAHGSPAEASPHLLLHAWVCPGCRVLSGVPRRAELALKAFSK